MCKAEQKDVISEWINHNKDCGKISAAASFGLVNIWDADEGLNACDKFIYSDDPAVVTGGLLGSCLVMSGVRDINMVVKALVDDNVFTKEDEKGRAAVPHDRRLAVILGLGLTYAGCPDNPEREAIMERLTRYIDPSDADHWHGVDLAAYSVLALGLVHVGQPRHRSNPTEPVVSLLMQISQRELEQPITR